MKAPYQFDEFFASGREESVSPFLTTRSRGWARNLPLKSAGLAACLLGLAFGASFVNEPLSHLLLSFVYFFAGAPALIATFDDLKSLEINIDVLMTLAAFLAVAIGSGLEGALLLVLFELSHGMEEMVARKARSALHNLNNLAPKFASVVDVDGTVYEQAVREVSVKSRLLVKQGEIVPLDGHIVEGTSSLNLVHLTGESVPQVVSLGDVVPAGARNLEAAITIEVSRTSGDSTLARIIQLIAEAHEAKPRLQRWLDRFSKTYATTIIGLTFVFALGLPWLFALPYLGPEGAVYRSLAFLIAASPCALIIATPTAYLSAISACAKKGILLKGGITLDALASCRTIAFDKTGTLTTGELKCTAIDPVGKTAISTQEALAIAAALERHVVHPIATAIVKMNKAPLPEIRDFKAVPGYGLKGVLENGTQISIGLVEDTEKKIEGEVLTALMVGNDRFLFRFSDQVRAETGELLKKLQEQNGLNPVMLTGDHAKNAACVAEMLGIETVFANLRPEDKLNKVAELSASGGLAMVGDGINDAPALARATVGISMGRIGSATAIDASDVVLLNDELASLSWLFVQARKTRRIVVQNVTLALCVIMLATIPALLGWVPLWMAVLLHEGGTVLVGLNSLRLLRK